MAGPLSPTLPPPGSKGQSIEMTSLAYVIQELLYSGICTQQAVARLAGALHTQAVLLHRHTSQHGGQHGHKRVSQVSSDQGTTRGCVWLFAAMCSCSSTTLHVCLA